MLRVAVVGQDTLAQTVAGCCTKHFLVTRTFDPTADVVWFCYDTPLTGGNGPGWVLAKISQDLQAITVEDPLIVISSQLPVGSTRQLEAHHPHLHFAYVPENTRVATAVADFEHQARTVVGSRWPVDHIELRALLYPFTSQIIWTDPETAEMSKHALNAFLALQIAFINEIDRLCGPVGADIEVVTQTLLTDDRVSAKAPLHAGRPFGGGHLARDIHYLNVLAYLKGQSTPLIANILRSNGDIGFLDVEALQCGSTS